MKRILILVFALLCPLAAVAQHQHGGKFAQPKAPLLEGVGKLNHPVSTKNPTAQRYFNQGLAFIYAFNHEEATRAFERAAQLDPGLAMAHWGIAKSVGPNYNMPDIDEHAMKRAFDAVQKAKELSANATERERAYIDALSHRFSDEPNPDLKKLSREYSQAMHGVHERYPDDLDAAVLYAESKMDLRPWQLWSNDGKPAEGTEEIVAVLESVLRRKPDHTGANHLYIHAVEASPNPERGLASALRMAALAPQAGHLVHMPAHIYTRIGDYAGAAKSNVDAAEADRRYIARTGANGLYPKMYYNHNLHFLAYARSMEGRFVDAKKAADQVRTSALPAVKEMPMIEAFVPTNLFVLVRFNKWNQILQIPKPDVMEMPITSTAWRYARGVAYAATGKIPEAEQELEALSKMVKAVHPEAMISVNRAQDVLKVSEQILLARISTAKNDHGKAAEHFRQAVALQDELTYDEPPGFYYPVRESLGGALLRMGDAKEAEKVFREDLRLNPRNGRSLFGLMNALRAQNKEEDAEFVESEFQTAWKNADSKLNLNDL